jgi:hypothetical protein
MKIVMKVLVRTAVVLALLATGFALGFPVGQQLGFATGSEWAIVQADIMAREAGLSMPVSFEEGELHIVIKQPHDLPIRARRQAELYEARARFAQADERTVTNKNQ